MVDHDQPPIAIVRFPAEATKPIFVRFEGVEIEVAICTREVFDAKEELAPEAWSALGVYVLSGPSTNPSRFDLQVRPGMTDRRPLLERIEEHAAEREWWRQVILIRRLTRAFDSAEPGYLETLLHTVIDAADRLEREPGSNRSDFVGPSDSDRKLDLETRVFDAIRVALRLGGLRLETAPELEAIANLRPRRRSDEVVS